MRIWVVMLAVMVFLMVGMSATAAPTPKRTVVSLTFDGSYRGQDVAAKILADHDMAGTFFVNSAYIGYPAYLSLDSLRAIARERNEIGGGSLYGNDLSKETRKRAGAEVCNDRATLAQLGFQVTSFAYPHAASPPMVKSVVQGCGYNSARETSGLYARADCSSCPDAEQFPVRDDFRIRTADTTVGLDLLQAQVVRAEQHGGWLPLVFTYICDCANKAGSISPGTFETFVQWLGTRPATTTVATVDQVMGGPLKSVVGKPVKRLVPSPSRAISRVPASKRPAVVFFGIEIGQSQILFVGIVLAIGITLSYRFASRGNRYVRSRT